MTAGGAICRDLPRPRGGDPPARRDAAGAKFPPPDRGIIKEIATGNSPVFLDLDADPPPGYARPIRDTVSCNGFMRRR